MKEKLTKFSRGVFLYEKPALLFSQESIEFSVEAGKVYEGSFNITTARHVPIKGILSKTDHFLKLSETSFSGTEITIHFTYDATELPAGETHVGSIEVISNCGEYEIPFMAKVEVPYFMTELGKIRDLFQFTNLAKQDWLSAMKLFKSDQFANKLLSHDTQNEVLYHSLMKSISTSHAMEEFLISIHKKVRLSLTVDKSFIEYSNVEETLEDKIVLHKDNWGYTEVHVETDVDFIEPEHKIIWSDNFIGNSYNLKFVIRKEKLKDGYNYGNIILKTPHQSFRVEVVAYGEEKAKNEKKAYKDQRNLITLTQNYLNFRMGRIAADQYMAEMRLLLNRFYELGDQDNYYLLKAHLAVSAGDQDEVDECFHYLENCKEEWREENSVLYCAYQYLLAVKDRVPAIIEEAAAVIADYYEKEPDNWRIFWFLMNVKKEYMEDARKRFEELEHLLGTGVHSSILYHEASMLYRDHPVFLANSSEVSVSVINWMIRENCMTEEVKQHYLLTVSKLKRFRPSVFHSLEKLYEEKEDVEVLQTILSMLVRAQKAGAKYFKWYELGVQKQVRILQLYEYYMYSMKEDLKTVLPESLLTYFSMNCTLHEKKRAFLYANIVKNRDEYGAEIVAAYAEAIRTFSIKELEKRVISGYLAVLYEELCKEPELEDVVKANLPYVMFQQELRCYDDNMVGVVVVHAEVSKETYTPLEDGVAQVAIYTDTAQIFLVDWKNNRYASTIEYCLSKYLSVDDLAKECFLYAQENGMLLLYLYEQLETYHNYAKTAVSLRKRLLLLEELKTEFHWNCYVKLVNYYYDTSQIALLDSMLMNLELEHLNLEDRIHMMELCIVRGIDQNLQESLERYGYEKISPKRIMIYCSHQLKNHPDTEITPLFLEMCFFALVHGKHTRQIVEVLCQHFIGNLDQLLKIWEAAKEYGIEDAILEEQIISQSLFTEVKKKQGIEVFCQYYKQEEKDKLVIRAYLSYGAFAYLLKDEEVESELREIMKEYIATNNCNIINLAYLKMISESETLSEQEKEFAEIQVQQYVKKKIMLPFFVQFKKHFPLPFEIANKYLVEYRGNANSKVVLHYALDSGHFTDEVMKNMYQGIFVKSFVLFHGDKLSYYFTEQTQDGEKKTETVSITYEDDMSETGSEYSLLNSLLVAKEMQDSKTVLDLMKQYVTGKTIMSGQFKMLE